MMNGLLGVRILGDFVRVKQPLSPLLFERMKMAIFKRLLQINCVLQIVDENKKFLHLIKHLENFAYNPDNSS